MLDEGLFQPLGEHGEAVLLAFAVSDGDLVHIEVYVFDPKPQALHEAQAGTVQERGHEVGCAVQGVQDRLDFGAGEDDGETFGPSGRGDAGEGRQRNTKDFAVEEQECVAGDVLGGSGDVLLDGQVGEVVTNGVGAEGGGVSFAVEDDEASDGGKIAVLGAEAEVLEADDGADLFQKGVRVARVGVARVKVVRSGSWRFLPGTIFFREFFVFLGIFGIMSSKAASRQRLVVGRCGNGRWIGRIIPHGCGKRLFGSALYRECVCGTDGNSRCCDLLLLECGKSRCYGVLCRARAV